MKPKFDYDSIFIEYNRLPKGGVITLEWGKSTITPFKRMLVKKGLADKQDFTARTSKGTAFIRNLTDKPIR